MTLTSPRGRSVEPFGGDAHRVLMTADLLRAASVPYVELFWTARAFASDDEQLGEAAASLHGTAVSVADQLEERLARAESIADCLAAYGSQLQWMQPRSASLVAACDEHHAALGRAEQELDRAGDDADLASLDLAVRTAAEQLGDAMADFDALADQFEREVETTIYRLRDIDDGGFAAVPPPGGATSSDTPGRRIPDPAIEIDFNDNVDARGEMARQLDLQEQGLRNLTIAEYLANREEYRRRQELTGEGRDPRAAAAQRRVRQEAEIAYRDELIAHRVPPAEAARRAKDWIGTQAALHSPDMVTGGHYDAFTGVGDATVNSAIGGQWGQSRADALEEHIRALTRGMSDEELASTYINVDLGVAP